MKKNYRRPLVFVVLMLFAQTIMAQQNNAAASEKVNIIKINVPALAVKNFSLQYERKLSRKTSFALAVRYRPEGHLPFQGIIKKAVDDTLIRVDLAKIGNLGITPEFRYYFGKKGALHGFYLGGFVSYNRYTGTVPVNYYDYVNNVIIDKTAPFSGSVQSFTAGIQLGAQWQLSDKWSFDWWIVGPNYGTSKGDFVFNGALNDIEQISLKFELEKIRQTIPMIKFTINPSKPDANGAAFKVDGPWAGIRAMGLTIGYRF